VPRDSHRPHPALECVPGAIAPDESSLPVTPLLGRVMLHFRETNNGGRRRVGWNGGCGARDGLGCVAERAGGANHLSDGGRAAATGS
jgi:hypothetical protein